MVIVILLLKESTDECVEDMQDAGCRSPNKSSQNKSISAKGKQALHSYLWHSTHFRLLGMIQAKLFLLHMIEFIIKQLTNLCHCNFSGEHT